MKFVVNVVGKNGSRVGCISNLASNPELILPTPMIFIHTRKGCVPHLTNDVLKMVLIRDSPPVCLPITSLVKHKETVMAYGRGISKFVGLEDRTTYLCIQDPAEAVPAGYNTKQGVALWPKSGRVNLDERDYLEIIESFQPDIAQILCDSDTPKGCTQKRIKKSLDRTLSYLDRFVLEQGSSEKLKKIALFATVEGGFDLNERQRSAKETALRPVSGFVIEGFHNNGPEAEDLNLEETVNAVAEVISLLPVDKPKMLPGAYRPDLLLAAVESGIDIFDTSYPYIVSERGGAFVFSYSLSENSGTNHPTGVKEDGGDHNRFEANMKDKRFAEDFAPIMESCSCLTCRKHTRAYINHLLMTGEMLSEVLLMIHNVHHYLEFFRAIREAIEKDRFEQLKINVFGS